MLVTLQFRDQLVVKPVIGSPNLWEPSSTTINRLLLSDSLNTSPVWMSAFADGGVQGDQGASVRLGHRLELRDDHIDHNHERDPRKCHYQGKLPDGPGATMGLRTSVPTRRRSCGQHLAPDARVFAGGHAFGPDLPVNRDAAADIWSCHLRGDVAGSRRQYGYFRVCPRQGQPGRRLQAWS